MTNPPPADADDYTFKTSLLGAAWAFHIEPDAIAWAKGKHTGRVAYASITHVRLSYRPVTMQSHRFVAEIWSVGAPKLMIASTSWKNMMEQERFDAAYTGFVRNMHRHIAAAGAGATFHGGLPAIMYWAGLFTFVVVNAGLAALAVRSAMAGAWGGAAVIVAFMGFFIWNGNFFRRNRPVRYAPDAIPPMLLPKP